MLHGDAPRARSLVQIGRKAGFFTTGGRGSGAPEMTPRDAAFATLLTLYDGPPTESGQVVAGMAHLNLAQVEVYPDGPRMPEKLIRAPRETMKETPPPLPLCFKKLPLTPLDALTSIFAASTNPYHLDQVIFIKGSAYNYITLDRYDYEIATESPSDSETDFFLFQAIYRELLPHDQPYRYGRQSEHSFGGAELTLLYDLIHGIKTEERD